MGAYNSGLMMGRAAMTWWQNTDAPPTQSEALQALDEICRPHAGKRPKWDSDDPARPGSLHPEYDQFTDPNAPIGRLIAIGLAATPEEISMGDEFSCPWQDGPLVRFMLRYRFK